MLCALLVAAALYRALEGLRLPAPVLTALLPLLVVCTGAAAALFGWRGLRRASLSAVASEVDARGRLVDEVKSALWFARQETNSAWESLMLRRAARKVSGLDLRALFPLRLPVSLRTAALLGVLVVVLGFVGRHTGQASDLGPASDEAIQLGRPASDTDAWWRFGGGSRPLSVTPARRAGESWTGPEKPNQSQSEAQAGGSVVRRGVRTPDGQLVPDVPLAAPRERAGGPVASDMLAQQAAQVSADVAQGLLDRLQALLGQGSDSRPKSAQTAEAGGEPMKPQITSEGQQPQQRDTDQHTTMDELNEALQALSQAPTGDQSMGNSPSPDNSGNNSPGNIGAGAMGMRVSTTEAGPGGGDTPPDAPSEALGVPALGKPTPRLSAQVQNLGVGAPPGEQQGAAEGFYVATQAQAARLELMTAAPPAHGSREAALTREQVPVAYRASVKRYFLIEHGKEP